MKNRVLTLGSVITILCSIFIFSYISVNASDNIIINVDGSSLTMQESSQGKTHPEGMERGAYLMDGECSITKAGRGKIYVYASTTANTDVDYVSAIIYVDRYNETTGKWGQIDSWQVEESNTYYVATSKLLTVERGYYYRVHASHAAGMDADYPYEEATSATDGIWID